MSKRTILALALCLISTALASAEGDGRPALPKYIVQPAPAQAVLLALSDCKDLDEADRPFMRYVWIPPWGHSSWAFGVSYAGNMSPSRATLLVRPSLIERGALVRWDLRKLAPKAKDFAELFQLWERMGVEPYFTVTKKLEVEEKDKDGKVKKVVKFVTAPSAHASPAEQTILRGLTQCGSPIVRADWFVRMTLTTLEGGLYYDFANIDKANENDKKSDGKQQTDQEKWLWKFGAVEAVSQALQGDQRAGILVSGVTGKPRRIDWFRGVSGRDNTGLIFLTHDPADEDLDQSQSPIRNLAKFKDKAREGIALRNNSLQEFVLFSNQGARQDSVPDNIARDGDIPFPHTARLQPAIGCIRCHGREDGYKELHNDVKAMVDAGFDVFGDPQAAKLESEEVDQLAGQYMGEPRKPLQRSRDDYEEAVVRLTGGRLPKLHEGESEVQSVSRIIGDIYGGYRYGGVDAQRACLELGYAVKDNADGILLLRALLPRLPADIDGNSPEDPYLAALKSGIKLPRLQWDEVYSDAAFRAWRTMETYFNKQKGIDP